MRYLESENLHIICRFTTGDNVTITVYDLSDDTKVVDEATMSEIETTGYFKYQFNPSPTTLTEYLYIASNGIEEHAGKIILGGYPDGIKNQTDKMNFSGNSIQARVADKGILNNPPSEDIDDYKADVSNLDVPVSSRNAVTPPTKAELDSAFAEIKGTTWTATTDTLEHIRDKETDIEADTNELQVDWANGGRLDLLLNAIPTTPMRGTDSAALASVCTEARLAELDGVNLPANIDNIIEMINDTENNVIEGAVTNIQLKRILLSAIAGKSTGGGTNSIAFRDIADSKNRITADVDENGNRTSVTINGS